MEEKLKIFFCEDDENLGMLLREYLQAKGYVTDLFSDGEAGYKGFTKGKYDLCVLDVMMPKKDGLQLCSEIKQDLRTGHIPVIIITAKSMVMHIKEGFQCGADDYIVKPFNTDLLKSTIANLITNRRLLRNKFSGAQQQQDKIEKISMKSNDEILMDRIMKVGNKHLDDPELNVEMLASEVGLSRVHVHRKLKELTNLSTRDFIKNIRLSQAASLLDQNKKMTISEVAYAVGYTNLSHFSNSFREKYGMSPKEYMNKPQ